MKHFLNEQNLIGDQLPSSSTKINSDTTKVENKEELLEVLFVSSGNMKKIDIAPFIKVQGESLKSENINVTYFKIRGKGILGYLKNISELRRFLKNRKFDLIHAHFTLSAWVVVLSLPKSPIVLSIMGTDAFGRLKKFSKVKIYNKYLTLLTIMIQPFVSFIITKSPNIERHVWLKNKSIILPNGVNLKKFDGKRVSYAKELGLIPDKKYVLFLGNPKDINKNFRLLEGLREKLKQSDIEIINPYPVSHEVVVKLLSTVDVLVMCSVKEGSPNVVKEALASNCKGVFTDVGDVRNIVEGVKGYAIINLNKTELENAIYKVMEMDSCYGRDKIKAVDLDSNIVAKKIRKIYINLLNK
ncbi:glycosyltransferase [Cyclobacterium sp. 1_MG-2023]|uniref:glycosyltransferase n=1 Tax=Cyclobacterium sp. 1_MG-2023 TaxID=3062681 RepID=UPI0026E313CA|nr:glycosyltransferase [Cyclobacterium sp. 1_MG-2023]MDO6440360.1 glycosyltransferase [Cyclobacterium sp. 1_MG-2023]